MSTRRSSRLANKEAKNTNEDAMWAKYESHIQAEKDHHDAIWSKKRKNKNVSNTSSIDRGNDSNQSAMHDTNAVENDTLNMVLDEIQFLEKSAAIHLQLNRQQAKELTEEYAKFLVLKIHTNDYEHKLLSPSAKIDQMWHLHLLHPTQYYSFCRRYANGHIINHYPDAKNDGQQPLRLQNTIRIYRETFGAPPSHIWEINLIKTVRRFRPC
eukprot:119856_1